VDAARVRLTARGLLDGGLTPAGRQLRERIERATDLGARAVIDRLGDRAEELFALLQPISQAMTGQGGYPERRSALFG
jgi:hypothetical protein